MKQNFFSVIKLSVVAIALVFGAASVSAINGPTTPPGTTGNTLAIVSTNDSNQIKAGALGVGITSPTAFSAAAALGYKVVSDGGAAFGPTAVFGNFTATGATISFPGLPNNQKGLCTDSTGKVGACAPQTGKTCGLKANQPVAVGCPAGAYLVQMSANGTTGTCRWLDPTHAGGTTVPNVTEMCY